MNPIESGEAPHPAIGLNSPKMKIKEIGHKWSYLQTTRYKSNTQPYYRLLGPQNEDLDIGSADYEHHGNASDFKAWLEKGLEEYRKADTKN